MASKFHPIPKWKSIVGTACSGVIMLFGLIFLICSVYIYEEDEAKLAVFVIGFVVALIGGIFLFINLVLFRKSTMERNKQATLKTKLNDKVDEEKVQTLHRLLEEGKISIEEYDTLMKK